MHPLVSHLVGVPAVIAGHVQPSGLFHYHGYPQLLVAMLRSLAADRRQDAVPLLLGYSADGFPIIDHVVAAAEGGRRDYLFSSYVLREGRREPLPRTNPEMVPGGSFDGLFVQDYVFDPERKRAEIDARLERGESYFGLTRQALHGGRASCRLLDPHNGTEIANVEGYQGKIFAYVLTPDWPMVPRVFAYEPDDSFKNIIPLDPPAPLSVAVGMTEIPLRGGPGRRASYGNCPGSLRSIREWYERPPY